MSDLRNPWREHMVRVSIVRILMVAEDVLYSLLALVLVAASIAQLIGIDWSLLRASPGRFLVSVLDHALVVLMLMELVHTLLLFLRSHSFTFQPFLTVGIVAGVRQMLLLTAQQAIQQALPPATFIAELLATAGIIMVLVLAHRWSVKDRRRDT